MNRGDDAEPDNPLRKIGQPLRDNRQRQTNQNPAKFIKGIGEITIDFLAVISAAPAYLR
jgi:hypothetical protein